MMCSVSWFIFSGVMGFVSLRDLLDDPGLLFDTVVDGVLVHEATDSFNELCSAAMQDSRCLSAPGCRVSRLTALVS